jgi:hypothetical protein
MKKILMLFVILFSIVLSYGQNLKTFENELVSKDKLRKERVEKSSFIKKYLIGNTIYELNDIIDSIPIYFQTHNVDAAKSSRTNLVNNLGLNGEGETLYIWDSGLVELTHQEFQGRAISGEVNVLLTPTTHATHVAGTMVGGGANPLAKGMASRANIVSYDWNSDLLEATQAAQRGMLFSNHSYGYVPNSVSVQWFGAYINRSRDWDVLMNAAPFYLQVVSAGNDGNGTSNTSPINPLKPQYDKLTGMATTKNNLVIAAAEDAVVDSNGNLLSVQITNFSSQGPTDDLRIKPDITGNGRNLYSSIINNNYGTLSGTSMSGPNVSGSLSLIQQHARLTLGGYLRAATIKGLVLHTADDAGIEGPDANFGWGMLNTKKAVDLITTNNNSSIIRELTLNNGQTYTTTVNSLGFSDLKVSISWTDPAGTTSTVLNDLRAVLVNDLDVRVTKNGTSYLPWALTGVDTNAKMDNNKDPFERVDITNPQGEYVITVTHKGTLNAPQNFSLIVSGLQTDNTCLLSTPELITVPFIGEDKANVSWSFVQGATYELQYRVINGVWINLTSNNTVAFLTGLQNDTTYEVRVRALCSNNFSNYTNIISFKTKKSCVGTVPSNLSVTNITSVGASFTWSSTEQSIYQVRYRVLNSTNYTTFNTSITSASVASFIASTTYQVSVRAICENGNFSDWSDEIMFTTLEGCIIVPPSSCTFSDYTESSVLATWNMVPNAYKYRYRWRVAGTSLWSSTESFQNSRVIPNLLSGTRYELLIQTICDSGSVSEFSNSFFFTTLGQGCTPATPLNVVASNITTNSVTVSWGGVSEQWQINYGGTTIFSTNNSISISNLNPNSTYSVSVRGRCITTGLTSSPVTISFTTLPIITCTPQSATQLTVNSITSNSANISWNGVSERWRITYGSFNLITTNNSIDLINLLPNTTYTVGVSGECIDSGLSSGVNFITFTTLPSTNVCNPLTPTGINLTNISQSQVTVNWSPVVNVSLYKVRISKQQGQPSWIEYLVNDNTLTILGLSPNTKYRIQVASVCENTTGSWSNNVNFQTLRNNRKLLFNETTDIVVINQDKVFTNFEYDKISVYNLLGQLISNTNDLPQKGLLILKFDDTKVFKILNN